MHRQIYTFEQEKVAPINKLLFAWQSFNFYEFSSRHPVHVLELHRLFFSVYFIPDTQPLHNEIIFSKVIKFTRDGP